MAFNLLIAVRSCCCSVSAPVAVMVGSETILFYVMNVTLICSYLWKIDNVRVVDVLLDDNIDNVRVVDILLDYCENERWFLQ